MPWLDEVGLEQLVLNGMCWDTLEALASGHGDPKSVLLTMQNCLEVCANLTRKARGKDVVLLLGDTGAGKSLLLNAMLGLQIQASTAHPNCFELLPSDRKKGAFVGHGNVSATFTPEC